jgi:ABC-type transport system involved in multi-copper enzyme maturation permease subunit
MKEIVAIARNTFKEAIRNRILYIILIFALILIGISGVISQLSISSQMQVIKNLGFASINFFGVAIAVFVGVSLVYNELEKKSIYTIVSKPISRAQFILGKYIGLLLTVWVNVLLMSYFFLVALHYYAGSQAVEGPGVLATLGSSLVRAFVDLFYWNHYAATANVMAVVSITCMEMMIVTAFSVLFSSFSTPTLSMIFTILTFVAGRLNESIIQFSEQIRKNANDLAIANNAPLRLPFSYYFARVAAHVVPNLESFSETVRQAIYDATIRIWWGTLLYGVLYTAGVLSLAILIFSRRNFK